MEEILVAPCGMNCALCISYQAMTHDLNKRGLRRKYCPGCVPRGQGCLHMGDRCDTLKDGRLRFCYECSSYPCARLKALDKRYRLKYHMSMLENLALIREHGVEALLQQEEVKWRCPTCGDTICCHNGLCLGCELDTLLANKSYRWGER
jgi:hypothetical protein